MSVSLIAAAGSIFAGAVSLTLPSILAGILSPTQVSATQVSATWLSV